MEGLLPKVFGIGLSRTGTTSLGQALNILGIKTIHYPYDKQTLEDLRRGNYKLSVLQDHQGVVDIPVAPYYAQLDQVWPKSRFILTVREKESWLVSCEMSWPRIVVLSQSYPDFREFSDFIMACVYGVSCFNRERYRYVYDTHIRNVEHYFTNRSGDLLIMDVNAGDGWEKLCPFLGVHVPNVEFPRLNPSTKIVGWLDEVRAATQDISALVPAGEAFILVDDGAMGTQVAPRRTRIPFIERDGLYWGCPADDATAIGELERLRRNGATFIVFARWCFWYLDYYQGFQRHLRSAFPCLLENERLVVFDLRGASDRRTAPTE